MYLSDNKEPPVIRGKIGQGNFQTDNHAFVDIKKNENAAPKTKDQK